MRRLVLIVVSSAVLLVGAAPVAAATWAPPGSSVSGVDGFQRFEATWDQRLPAFDRYLWAVAPDDVLLAPLPADSGEGRRVVYSLEDQMVWLVTEDGSVVANYLVSGRKGWPEAGTYEVFSKSPITRAYLSPTTTMRWMVRFARTANTNIGFHDIPLAGDGTPYQTLDELGTALSGGCIRQSSEDAIRMYRFAGIGTTVVVTP